MHRTGLLPQTTTPVVQIPTAAALPLPLAQVGLLNGLIMRPLVVHLLNHIRSFSDWAQCLVLDIVTRYQPASEAERFDVLEVRCARFAEP
jgi:hypothetical protein